MARRRSPKTGRGAEAVGVPGATDNPATNLLLADIMIRTGSYVLRRMVERGFLKQRYGKQTARDIVKNRSLAQTLTSVAVSRLATRSLPGAAIVGTCVLAKILYERGKSRHSAQADGNAELLEIAED
jgi:hypothetical protein